MDNQIVIHRLRLIFAQSAIKTVGELIDSHKLAGFESLPAHIREHSLQPDSVFLLPGRTFFDMARIGMPLDSYSTLLNAVADFRMRMVDQASGTPKPRPV